MDNFTPEPRLKLRLDLNEAEAHGLRDILDWLDIHQPADFTLNQRDGLERLLESLGRNQIERYFALELRPSDSAVEYLLRRERKLPIPLLPDTGIREGEVIDLTWGDVAGFLNTDGPES